MSTQLVLDALEQTVWTRGRSGSSVNSSVAHTDRGPQYTSIRYGERLAEAGIAASVGTVGDSYDTQSTMMLWAADRPVGIEVLDDGRGTS